MPVNPYGWSTTAASNTTVGGVSIAEGTVPGNLNNSDRAIMAGVKEILDAISGTKVTAGTATAYTLTTGLSLSALATGQILAFEAHTANTGAATIAIDSLSAVDLKRNDLSDLVADDLVAKGIYLIAYESTDAVMRLLNVTARRVIGSTDNTALGKGALGSRTTGVDNVAIGEDALGALTTGDDNTAVGHNALGVNTVGISNTAVGDNALGLNTTGTHNVAVGDDALLNNTTGIQNTAVGTSAGSSITTGSNLSCFGYDAEPSSATATNEVTIGNTSVTSARVQVAWTVLSDGRDKENIEDLGIGLDFVRKLRPRKFVWNTRNGEGLKGIPQPGFVAQEVLEAEKEMGVRDVLNLVRDENPERLEWTPDKLLPIIVRALQEQSDQLDELRARLAN